MQFDKVIPGNTILKVILLQAALVAALSIMAWLVDGLVAAQSVIAGGATVLAGNAAYAWLARKSKVSAVSGNAVLLRHVLAEIAKILIVLALMLGAFSSGLFLPGWLLGSIAIALMGHWVAVLVVRQ